MTQSIEHPERERRINGCKLELRAAPAGSSSPGTLAGYAAVFNQASCDLGGFREVLSAGCFRAAAADSEIICSRNHVDDQLLGRVSAGTLRIEEDDEGLRYECDLPDTTHGRDTAEMVRRGDMHGCSFQFSTPRDGSGEEWDFTGPMPFRTITRVEKLHDVGPVTEPAYRGTSVACRSFDAARTAHEAAQRSSAAASLSLARARQQQAEAETHRVIFSMVLS